MSILFQSLPSLSIKDFAIFHAHFCHEVELLLPVSAAIYFWEQGGEWLPEKEAKKLLGKGLKKLPVSCESLKASIINGVLIIPLSVTEGNKCAVIIGAIDPGLLGKMAPEWLQELQGNIQKALVKVKQDYIYPDTGLYSSRLLGHLWQDLKGNGGAFFLIGILDRAGYSTNSLVKFISTVHQIEASTGGPVIYFGGNVLGVCQKNISRNNALEFARRLLGRLKREGVNTVHIGITFVQEDEELTLEKLLSESWQALEIAEQRGPFSLCESSFLHNQKKHPLAKPSRGVVGRLQKKWRGLKQFCLLLFRVEEAGEMENYNSESLECIIESFYDPSLCVPVSSSECYVILPEVSPRKGESIAREFKKRIDGKLKPLQVAVGISYWPCQDYSRTATVLNCRKALMHGDFLGQGSVTLFDHVSLNVSGDYYFDEGDYRQAVREYRDGLKIIPREVNLLNSLGVTLTELNRLSEALNYFNLVLEQEPKNFMALVNKGFALRMMKKDEEALSYLAKAQKCKEFTSSLISTDILMQLGRLYSAKGQYRKAVKVLEKIKSQKSEKNGYALYNLLGKAYAETGDKKKAVKNLQKAIRYNPHDAGSLSILGDLYGAQGEGYDVAVSLCSQAVNIDDRSWDNWYRLAKVMLMMKEYEKAQDAVRESLLRNRNAVEAIFLAGKIHIKLGNTKQAKKNFQKVLRIAPGFPGVSKALQKLT